MRRLLRILLNAATVLSLALCVAVCVLWVRSQFIGDRLMYVNAAGTGWVQSGGGTIAVTSMPEPRASPGGREWRQDRADAALHPIAPGATSASSTPVWVSDVLGVACVEGAQSYPVRRPLPSGVYAFQSVAVPYSRTAVRWRSLALLTALLPAAVFGPPLVRRARLIRRRSRSAGLCPACGYDLRATPDRCPECGRTAGPA